MGHTFCEFVSIHRIWLSEGKQEAIIDLCIVNDWFWFYQHQRLQEEELYLFLDRVREEEDCDPWDHVPGSRNRGWYVPEGLDGVLERLGRQDVPGVIGRTVGFLQQFRAVLAAAPLETRG